MKKIVLFIISCSLGIYGCSSRESLEKEVILKLAHITSPDGMLHARAEKFAELVAEKTDNQVKVEIYPAQQLGHIKEILHSVSMGTIEIAQESESFMDTFDRDYSIFSTPFMFSRVELNRISFLEQVRERVRRKTGIRTLPGFAFRPVFHLWSRKKPIKSPEDLNGIKIRVWQSRALVDTWNGLGATAVPLAWGDVYLSLAQHIVNGMVHNIVQVRDEKFYEQLDYCTKLDFMPLYDVTWINDRLYRSLPQNFQTALTEASQESAGWFVKFGQSLENQAQEQLERAGIEFIEVDREPWVRKALQVHRQLEGEGLWSEGLLEHFGKGSQ